MSEWVSARDAIIRDIASAKSSLKIANEVYDAAKMKADEAQKVASHASEGHKKSKLHFDRLNKALAVIEGHDE